MDAANVDLKGFTEDFYHRVCAGHLQPVLDTLVYLAQETQVWLEVTTLLIPGQNDDEAVLEAQCAWMYEHLGPDVPLHFTAFHPDYRMLDVHRTPPSTLRRGQKKVIERDRYQILSYALDEAGRCLDCGQPLPGRFDGPVGDFGRRRERLHLL